MNREFDLEASLDRWMADGPATVSDGFIDAVSDRISRRRQRRARPDLWRQSVMQIGRKQLSLAAGILAVAAAVALVVRPFGFATTPGATPSPAPIVTPSDRATQTTNADPSISTPPSSAAAALPLPAGFTTDLGPGTFMFNRAQPRLVFKLTGAYSGSSDATGFRISRGGFNAEIVVLYDPRIPSRGGSCKRTAGAQAGTTPADVIADLTQQVGLEASQAEPVSIGGLPGVFVDVELSKDAPDACLSHAGQTNMQLLTAGTFTADPATVHLDDNARIRVYVLDAGQGRTIAIAINTHRGTALYVLLADAKPVIESFAFELAP
ncbi:MAG: hypothetical protein H0U52_13785 [Chloroflexi bacterium]|nr:hypothetical protein [Chloroflexota bacterium]